MQILVILLLAIHVLAGVFWAGSTFALAHSRQAGARRLFGAQMAAATLSAAAGALLWGILHRGPPAGMEKTLAAGALCAVLAAGAQGALRKSPQLAQRIAAALLAITVVCMTVARYAG
jgi:hypothetical protein